MTEKLALSSPMLNTALSATTTQSPALDNAAVPSRPTVQPQDLFDLAFLQDAQFSSDGMMVVYTVLTVDAATDEERSTIYLQTIQTDQIRALTNGCAQDSAPRWSPDDKSIAFRSTRNGKAQIFMIAVDGGEAYALTAMLKILLKGPSGRRMDFNWRLRPHLSKNHRHRICLIA